MKDRFINRVLLDINNYCNLRCIMCGVPDMESERIDMGWDLYRKIAQQVFPVTRELWLSCSFESLISADSEQLLSYIGRFEIPYSCIYTNGTSLSRSRINALVDSGISSVIVSFDGAVKKTFETIRRGAGFEDVVKNIRLLNKEKRSRGSETPELRFATTILKENMDELPEIVRLASELSVRKITFKPLQKLNKSIKEEISCERLKCSIEEVLAAGKMFGVEIDMTPELKQLNRKDLERRGEDHAKRRSGCGEDQPVLVITAGGLVSPCTMWSGPPVGDFKNQTFEEIWEMPVFKNIRENSGMPDGRCSSCRYFVEIF